MNFARSIATASVLVLALGTSACLGTGHSINAYAGSRFLNADDWDDLDNPLTYGADAVLKVDIPWLAVEGGWLHTDDDKNVVGGTTDAKLTLDEYFVGLRVTPWTFIFEPYASAGVSYVDSGLDATGVDASDDVLAYYARLGGAFHMGPFRIGIDGRALFGSDVSLDTLESDVDGYTLMDFVGVGF